MIEPENILTLNFGGIGDEILFLPTLHSLKKKYPNAKITLCLEPRSRSIKALSDLIDETIEVDIKGKNKYIELLKLIFIARSKNFDLVVSSGTNKFISILLFLMGIKYRYGYYSGALSKILLTKAIPLNKEQYAGNMYHDLVKELTKENCELPKIKTQTLEKEPNTVVIHPGVSKMSVEKNMIKTVPDITWAEIIKSLLDRDYKVILAGGPDDDECIKNIVKELKDINNPDFINYFGQTKNIMDLAKLIAKSSVLICCDSSPMHIGVCVNTKTIAIFGPTDEKKLLPENENFIAIKNEVKCRPCLFDKRKTTCESLDCLKIDVAEIISNV